MVKTMKKMKNTTDAVEDKELIIFTEYVGKALEKDKRYYFKNIVKIDNICVNVEINKRGGWGIYLRVGFEHTMDYEHDDEIMGYISCINKEWDMDVARGFLEEINTLFYSKIMGKFYTSKEKEAEELEIVRIEDEMSVLFVSPHLCCHKKQIDVCCVCLEETAAKLGCDHNLCFGCRYQLSENDDGMKACPLCRDTF
jgi:hypothetical protein